MFICPASKAKQQKLRSEGRAPVEVFFESNGSGVTATGRVLRRDLESVCMALGLHFLICEVGQFHESLFYEAALRSE